MSHFPFIFVICLFCLPVSYLHIFRIPSWYFSVFEGIVLPSFITGSSRYYIYIFDLYSLLVSIFHHFQQVWELYYYHLSPFNFQGFSTWSYITDDLILLYLLHIWNELGYLHIFLQFFFLFFLMLQEFFSDHFQVD